MGLMTGARSGLASIVLTTCPCLFALNPTLEISQYAHTVWTVRDGLFKGYISSMAQTPDGYLWLGTEFGLLRFDGVRTVPWQPPAGQRLRSNRISALLAARDGTLWIGTTEELVSLQDGRLTTHPEIEEVVSTIYEDRTGAIWATTSSVSANAKLCAFRSGRSECFGDDGSFGRRAADIYEDSAGALWIGSFRGLWRWRPGPQKLYPMDEPASGLADVIQGDDGVLWMARRDGIHRLIGNKPVKYPLLGDRQFRAHRLFRDRDGGLWVGTVDRGLLHSYQGKIDIFGPSDGLSNGYVLAIFEDREGTMWVATGGGLDRFREFAVPRFSTKQGLPSDSIGSMVAAREGSLWLASLNGLNRRKGRKIDVYRHQTWSPESGGSPVNEIVDAGLPSNSCNSLFEDSRGRIWVSTAAGIAFFENGHFVRASDMPRNVFAMAEDEPDSLWIVDPDQGLVHLIQGRVIRRIPWTDFARPGSAPTDIARDPAQGGLWISFSRGGVVYFQDGKIRRSIETAGGVSRLRVDSNGVLWAATQGGLVRLGNNGIETMTSANGLPCNAVNSMVEDDDHALWLNTACGIVRVDLREMDGWVSDPKRKVRVLRFDESDGAISRQFDAGYGPPTAKTDDGKLWFRNGNNVSMVDPHRLPLNTVPPPVHIEQITADRKVVSDGRLPPLPRDLEIDYTALSLAAPEKIQFKYRLEGHDPDWVDAGNRRQAFYNDLPPSTYRFRVIASNNSGVWNEAGDTLEFAIAPAYYQTIWFRVLIAAAVLAALWGLYRLRLYQVAREFNVSLEARVAERTRMARDLHDTLLQSFQGLMLRLQAVDDLLPEGKAKEQLEQTLQRGDQAIAEGRSTVYDLRSSATTTNELAEALRALGEELATEDSAAFQLVVEGATRELHPIIRDEIYRITGEALRNAFKHARAKHIETELFYGEKAFRLRIRDDGEGIPTEILKEGRAGHYGLKGMRERARQVGGKLDIWSGAGTGTEIEFSIPGSIAYGAAQGSARLGLFGKRAG